MRPVPIPDREALVNLLEAMGYRRKEPVDGGYPGPREYWLHATRHTVVFGAGDGFGPFYATFDFDDDGSATTHGLWEST